ncbi:MAG: hypothetical protein LBQ69_01125 [Treponema sp.]|jgi:hypothetical protein|nr:hypothetical protein [Treponema sp.]
MNQARWCRTFAFVCLFAAFSLVAPGAWAQSAEGGGAADKSPDGKEGPALPRQFREIVLGMSLDELKEALLNDDMFNFRGDRDVSFLPAREESLVETSGSSFIRRAFFQLRDGSLFIMAFTMNTGQIDHYSIFTDLVRKYGPPSYLDPKEAVWETEDTRLALERPLTVKYIDKRVFDDIINESSLVESRRVLQRQEFLDEF